MRKWHGLVGLVLWPSGTTASNVATFSGVTTEPVALQLADGTPIHGTLYRSDASLDRMPGVVVLHVWALHVAGQGNPAGVEAKTDKDTVPFTPYATIKDAFGLSCFLLLYMWFVFYLPDYLGHSDNYIEANPLSTPPHIVPEWYFLPYYAILRAIPDKLLGVIAMFSSILLLIFIPWLDTSRVRSTKYRPLYRWFFWMFIVSVIALGYLGSKPPEPPYVGWARLFTAYYFLHLLVILPIVGVIENPKPLPRSISEAVLGKEAARQGAGGAA